MHIEIKDPSLVERLKRLLPRPDAPFDEAIRLLLEQPCRMKAVEMAREAAELAVKGRIAEEIEAVVEEVVERKLDEAIKRIVDAGIAVDRVVAERLKALDGIVAKRLGDAVEEGVKKALIDANVIEAISEKAAGKAVRKALKSGGFKYTVGRIIKEIMEERMLEILEAAETVGRGGWEAVTKYVLKMPDKCLPFHEIKRLYRRELNSEMLRNRGFVKKGKGIWCYTGVGETEKADGAEEAEDVAREVEGR